MSAKRPIIAPGSAWRSVESPDREATSQAGASHHCASQTATQNKANRISRTTRPLRSSHDDPCIILALATPRRPWPAQRMPLSKGSLLSRKPACPGILTRKARCSLVRPGLKESSFSARPCSPGAVAEPYMLRRGGRLHRAGLQSPGPPASGRAARATPSTPSTHPPGLYGALKRGEGSRAGCVPWAGLELHACGRSRGSASLSAGAPSRAILYSPAPWLLAVDLRSAPDANSGRDLATSAQAAVEFLQFALLLLPCVDRGSKVAD